MIELSHCLIRYRLLHLLVLIFHPQRTYQLCLQFVETGKFTVVVPGCVKLFLFDVSIFLLDFCLLFGLLLSWLFLGDVLENGSETFFGDAFL